MQSTVSVVIPTYNRAHMIREAIESVLRQTLPVQEIIVVDDGSTDATGDIVGELAGPIRYFRQPNGGPGMARNRGIKKAVGDWIAFLDSDDLWIPRKNEMQMDYLRNHPDLDLVFASMALISDNREDPAPEILNDEIYRYCVTHATNLERLFECLLVVNVIPAPTVMLRRSKIAEVGLMTDQKCAEDYEWWIRWSLHCKCGFLDSTVLLRRIHSSNIVGDRTLMLRTSLDSLLGIQGNRRLNLSAGRVRSLQQAIHRRRYDLGSHYFHLGNFPDAFQTLRAVPFWSLWKEGATEPAKLLVKSGLSFLRSSFVKPGDRRPRAIL